MATTAEEEAAFNPLYLSCEIKKEPDDNENDIHDQDGIEENDTRCKQRLSENTPVLNRLLGLPRMEPSSAKILNPLQQINTDKNEFPADDSFENLPSADSLLQQTIAASNQMFTTLKQIQHAGPPLLVQLMKPFLCSVCNTSFMDKVSLDTHMRTQHERGFPCDICGRLFYKREVLVNHRRIHTGEKPYVCKFCDKRFTQLSILFNHTRLHTGERPYRCTHCGQSFAQNSTLKKHKENVHRDFTPNDRKKIINRKEASYEKVPRGGKREPKKKALMPKIALKSKESDMGNSEVKMEPLDRESSNDSFHSGSETGHLDAANFKCLMQPLEKDDSEDEIDNDENKEIVNNTSALNIKLKPVDAIHDKDDPPADIPDSIATQKPSPPTMVTRSKSISSQSAKRPESPSALESLPEPGPLDHQFRCEHCGKYFFNSRMLRQHRKSHKIATHTCFICMKIFDNQRELDTHLILVHHTIPCPHCDMKFIEHPQLVNHLHEVHQDWSRFQLPTVLPRKRKKDKQSKQGATPITTPRRETDIEVLADANSLLQQTIAASSQIFSALNKTLDISNIPLSPLDPDDDVLPTTVVAMGNVFNPGHNGVSLGDAAKRRRVYNPEDLNSTRLIKRENSDDTAVTAAVMTPTADDTTNEFSCKFCTLSFASVKLMRQHMSEHDPIRPYMCEFCDKMFAKKDILINHRRVHTGERPYECTICHRRFTQLSILFNHSRLHTGERPYNCQHCGLSFAQNGTLKKHLQATHNDFAKMPDRRRTENRHLKTNFSMASWSYNPDDEDDDVDEHSKLINKDDLRCYVCGDQFECLERLNNHISEHEYVCPECDKVFDSNKKLWLHMDETHALSDAEKSVGEIDSDGSWLTPFKCNVCAVEFKNKSALARHRKAEHSLSQSPLKCDICFKSFRLESTLQNHKVQHDMENDSQRKCRKCGVHFTSKSKYDTHVCKSSEKLQIAGDLSEVEGSDDDDDDENEDKTDYEDNGIDHVNFQCHICNIIFNSSESLEFHVREHGKDSGESFDCNYCLETFDDCESLEQHLEIHAEEIERDYNQEFYNSDGIVSVKTSMEVDNALSNVSVKSEPIDNEYEFEQRLNKAATGGMSVGDIKTEPSDYLTRAKTEQIYVCSECGASFVNQCDLNEHAKTHDFSQIHKCEFCLKTFAIESTFSKHVRLHSIKKFMCLRCRDLFSTQTELSEHSCQHEDSEEILCCLECKKCFETRDILDSHVDMCHPAKTIHS